MKMGVRANKLPLTHLKFQFLPKEIREKLAKVPDDPEAPHLQRLYIDCFKTVFGKEPEASEASRCKLLRDAIVRGAHEAHCSVRLFLLSNMLAHQLAQRVIVDHTEKARRATFRAKQLESNLAVKHALTYGKMCRDRYGTFNLSSLEMVTGEDAKSNLDNDMLASEITAGRFVVGYKMHQGGPPLEALYESEELQLSPYWLAIEPSYDATILQPHLKNSTGTPTIRKHRWDVSQVIGQLKRHGNMQTVVFQKREAIMPQALLSVLSSFGHSPEDFLWPNEVVTNAIELYTYIGRTIQHYQLLQFIRGEDSIFRERKKRVMDFSS